MYLLEQKTLRQEVSLTGVGLFTGRHVTMRLVPTEPGTGLWFQRKDLSGAPCIPVHLKALTQASRTTKLAVGEASVQTVEHLLSALYAYGISNLQIQLDGPEVPIVDGSAMPFVALIEQAGVLAQAQFIAPLRLPHAISWSSGDVHLIALPSEEFRVSYTAYHPQSTLFRTQYCSLAITPEGYRTEIAPCRTFSFFEEVAPLLEKGLIRGATLENAVVIRQDQVISPGGLRHPEELARHKILDLVGDLALLGAPIFAHIVAIRSGHATHATFAALLQDVVS